MCEGVGVQKEEEVWTRIVLCSLLACSHMRAHFGFGCCTLSAFLMGESYVCMCMQVCEMLQFLIHHLLPRTPVSILTAPFPVGVLLYCYCCTVCVCVCVCVCVGCVRV